MQSETVQTLEDLGLTVLQAKVYFALTTSGTLTARSSARSAKVASQDVYRVLAELQEKGLIEKIIGKPCKYRPIPMEEGLSMLLQRREKQTEELKRTAFEIFKDFGNLSKPEDNDRGDFILIPQKEPLLNRIRKTFESAQSSIDLTNNVLEGIVGYETSLDLRKKAISGNVKIRDLLCNPRNVFQIPEALSLMKKKPAFQIRYANRQFPAKLLVKDKQEMLVSTMPETGSTTQPYLWSNNPVMLNIVQQWFDMKWTEATDPTNYN